MLYAVIHHLERCRQKNMIEKHSKLENKTEWYILIIKTNALLSKSWGNKIVHQIFCHLPWQHRAHKQLPQYNIQNNQFYPSICHNNPQNNSLCYFHHLQIHDRSERSILRLPWKSKPWRIGLLLETGPKEISCLVNRV